MITSAIKIQTSVCCSISLNPYMAFQTWESWKKKLKRKAILLLAYIADVSCLTNRSFYTRTLSLSFCDWRNRVSIDPTIHTCKLSPCGNIF